MKKIFLLLIVSFLFTSCLKEEINSKTEDLKTQAEQTAWDVQKAKWVIQDTREVLNDYWDTLQWSVNDARAVKDLMNEKNQQLQDDIQKAYK